MESLSVPLEIHIHLEDGRIVKFAQESAESAYKLLHDINPGRLFSNSVLLLSDHQSIIAFQSAMVVRVDFVTNIRLDWPFPTNIKDCREVTRQEVRQDRQAEIFLREALSPMWVDIRPCPADVEIEMVDGSTLYLEVFVQESLELPLDQSLFLQHLFGSRGLHARRKEGGMIVVNPACIARFTFYPGAITTPPGVWEAALASA